MAQITRYLTIVLASNTGFRPYRWSVQAGSRRPELVLLCCNHFGVDCWYCIPDVVRRTD